MRQNLKAIEEHAVITFISELIINELQNLADGKTSHDQFQYLIAAIESNGTINPHPDFFEFVRTLAMS